MEKLHFIYIGKDWDGNSKTDLPNGTIQAIKAKYDNGEYHYVPIIPSRYETADKVTEIWICGQGWVKIGKRKRYEIPVFDGTIEHYKDYLSEWGEDIMAYCLHGDLFNRSNDCCDINYQNEWICLNYYGPEKYNEFAVHYSTMLEYQKKWFIEHHLPIFKTHGYGDVSKNYMFKPELNLGFSFLPVPCMGVDILHDDKKLEELYKRLRYWDLYEKHEQYQKYLKCRKDADDYRNGRSPYECRWDREYENLCEKWHEIDHIIHKDVDSQIKYELEAEYGVPEFPQCFNERLEIMFGSDVKKEYDFLVKYNAEEQTN